MSNIFEAPSSPEEEAPRQAQPAGKFPRHWDDFTTEQKRRFFKALAGAFADVYQKYQIAEQLA